MLREILTAAPALQLHLQSLDGVSQTLVLLFLFLILSLPLLSRQLQVNGGCVLDGFSTETHNQN